MLFKVGQQFTMQNIVMEITYINEGKQRFTLTPVSVKAHQKAGADGKFIHDMFLNGDPVWMVYQNDVGHWIRTEKPQSVFNYAYGDRIAIAGEEPYLYGYHFADKEDLFTSREAADDECERRNGRAQPATAI